MADENAIALPANSQLDRIEANTHTLMRIASVTSLTLQQLLTILGGKDAALLKAVDDLRAETDLLQKAIALNQPHP